MKFFADLRSSTSSTQVLRRPYKGLLLSLQGLSLAGLIGLVAACAPQGQSEAADESQNPQAEQSSLHPDRHFLQQRALKPVDPTARQAVVQAYEAQRTRQWQRLPTLAQSAQNDYQLGAYPMFWYLRHQVNDATQLFPTTELNRFLQTYKHTYVAERLKADWAKAAANRGDYQVILALDPINLNDSQAQCALTQAKLIAGHAIRTSEAMSTFKPGKNCWGLLNTLQSQGQLHLKDVQALLRDAVEYDDKQAARHYANAVFTAAQMSDYDRIYANPKAWIAQQSGVPADDAHAELRAIAFSRLARQDRQQGIEVLRQTQLLREDDKRWAFTQFALVAALNREPQAHAWYQEAKGVYLRDYNAAWRVRAALYQAQIDWQAVFDNIERMNQAQRQETAWRYWRARALQALGKQSQAQAGFTSLLSHDDFYGQLAREALGQKIQWPQEARAVSSQEVHQIQRNSGLQNAIALFNMGAHASAVAEWNFAIQGLSDRQLLAAAQWALDSHFYDRAINTSLQSKSQINMAQRFPAPFDQQVRAEASKQGVDPAWVYGLIRQESRFVTVARSSSGAAGLMQIMPETARVVARKLGMGGVNRADLHDFNLNTLLGTAYLRMTLDRLNGSELLATAGYNAGPNRAIRWQNDFSHPIEAAIFVETIPYTETRIYVKNVMANTIWYSMMFNHHQAQSLTQRLGTVR
ncbi:lytic transglycosylase domain-containing protein [Brackiella oedipodis]|uniref:lytic transglycosylase domain-containing protein n=1 Tax=Brackiella oedipodis TaxID=124225 RepID=UPI0009FBBB1F|nr:lytic transglycosylase domain-containing protein [Brackiella oedipodis]